MSLETEVDTQFPLIIVVFSINDVDVSYNSYRPKVDDVFLNVEQ